MKERFARAILTEEFISMGIQYMQKLLTVKQYCIIQKRDEFRLFSMRRRQAVRDCWNRKTPNYFHRLKEKNNQ